MNDKELLDLAAKAAQVEIFWGAGEKQDNAYLAPKTGIIWNPLKSDGDAMRLAVELGLFSSAGIWRKVFDMRNGFDFGVDECAATRRAIVCVAAEIGRLK